LLSIVTAPSSTLSENPQNKNPGTKLYVIKMASEHIPMPFFSF